MSLIRKFARPLLASTFVYDGLQRLRSPQGQEYLKPLVDTAATTVPQLRPLKGQEQLIGQAAAGAQIGAAALFGLGRFPRLSSAVLLAAGALNAYTDFRRVQARHEDALVAGTLKNVSLVGAVALTAVDTEGSPSLKWRAEKLGHDVAKKTDKITKDVKKKSEDLLG